MKLTWNEVLDICRSNRESDGFCRICCSCSGPSYSNLACDYQAEPGVVILRGGNHGNCKFEIVDDSSKEEG